MNHEARSAPSSAGKPRKTVEEMGCPTYQERLEAANIALEIEDARKGESGRAPIADRAGYRNRIAQNFTKPERWAECRALLDQLEEEPPPEAPEEEALDDGLITHIDRDGHRHIMTLQEYRSMLYDFEGPPDADRRPVRAPFDWIESKHQKEHRALIALERASYATREELLEHATLITKHRWRYAIARSPRTVEMSVFLLERLEDFRRTIAATFEAFELDGRPPS